jgi:hypothetical protein
MKIEETQLDLQAVSTFHDTLTKSLCKEMGGHEEGLSLGAQLQDPRNTGQDRNHMACVQNAVSRSESPS